jgi:hypothetical protein
MAASKSVSRKPVANKSRKTRKSRAAAKKTSKTRKQRAAGKKAAATRKRRTVVKKALVTRKTKAAVDTRAKTTVNIGTRLQRRRMPEGQPAIAEIDDRIAIVRDNLRELVEQAASYSGASNEELMSQRIAEQEEKLELLKKQREELSQVIAT